MTRPRLKIYTGPNHEPRPIPTPEQRSRIQLSQLLAILQHANEHERTWLQDFAEEEITVSEDLHEVLQVYEQLAKTDPGRTKSA